jgi:hypothetical protein
MLDAWCRAGLLYRGKVQPDILKADAVDYVALTAVGTRALYAATGNRIEGMSGPRLKRGSQKRNHDLQTGEMALAVTSLAKEGRIDLCGVEVDDRKLATVIHIAERGREPERIVLQPDGLIVTKGRVGNEALLVEIDRATTAPKKMQVRYRGYLHWQREQGPRHDFGIGALRVLTLVPTKARLDKLHAAALAANDGRKSGFLIFGLLDDFTVCTAERWLELAARPLGGDPEQRVRLLSAAA